MFSHVMVGADNVEAARRFYDAVLGALGTAPGWEDPKGRFWWRANGAAFGLGKPIDGEPACHANGGTIGFAGESPAAIDAAHAAGLAAGGSTCEEPPGTREGTFGPLYLAYLRDPAGNKICLLHRMAKA